MCHPGQLSAEIKESTRPDRPIMQMSFRSTIRSMVRNMKETFLPKTGIQKKQVLQDPGYVKDACCMLHALCKIMLKMSKILKQAITDFIEFIYFLSKMLKMCTNYNVDSNSKSSNYMKIQFKALITLNYNRVRIKTSN